jgi:hypothetical protein
MIPRAETVRFDQDVEDKYERLIKRRAELNAKLIDCNHEQDAILSNLGELVAEGGDWQKQTARLAALRLESGALEQGIKYIDGQKGLLKRMNSWLKTR